MARVAAIACDYEDAIDLGRLRHDPLMKLAVGRCRERRSAGGWLAGAVVELGRAVGIPTPLNRAVADILALREAGTGRPA
jgi:ketopantoate reductase